MVAMDLRNFARRIKVGKKYVLPRCWLKDCDIPFLKVVHGDLSMKCVEKYRHMAVFETTTGIRTSFTYYDLMTFVGKNAVVYNRKTWEGVDEQSLVPKDVL